MTSTPSANQIPDRLALVTEALVALGTDEFGDLDQSQLEAVVARVRTVQRLCDGLLARAALRATALAARGSGAGPEGLLTGHGEVAATSVRAEAGRARVTSLLPSMGAMLSAGRIGADHLDVVAGVVRKAGPAELAALRAAENGLADAAAASSADSFQRRVHRMMARIRSQLGVPGPEAGEADVRLWWGRDNMGHIAGRLTAEQHERVVNAIGAEMTTLARHATGGLHRHEADRSGSTDSAVAGTVDHRPTVSLDGRLAAEALVSRVAGIESGRSRGTGRPAITIIVDARTGIEGPDAPTTASRIYETESGGQLSPEAFDRCACDAVLRRVMVDGRGVPVDVGRAQRTATDAQWSALKAIYSGCAWFGCDRPLAWCQAHHVKFWEHGGPTDLDNLVPLCSQHHHLAHEGGWRLRLTSARALRHHQPDGTMWRISHPDRLRSVADRPNRSGPTRSPSVMSAGPGDECLCHTDTAHAGPSATQAQQVA